MRFSRKRAVVSPAEAGAATAPADEPRPFGRGSIPDWFKRAGVASWYLIGIVIVLIGLAYLLHALATLVVPTLFAILLGATFLPVVDWLQRHHVGRAWGALLVTVGIVVGAFALAALMTIGVIHQWSTIEQQVQDAVDWINRTLKTLDIDPKLVDSARKTLTSSAGSWAKGIFGGALQGVSTLATFAFGAFIGLNILVYVLIGGRQIGRWCSEHMGPVPPAVGYSILANSARFLRGYIWGSTLIGLFNGAVVAVGALIVGVPLAFTIFVVQWLTNYIPMFGAFIGGAFAVLIALGTGGLKDAVWMLIFVLIANGPLQTVVSQFALGASLKLSGLVVLFATTGGAILAGALGGIFAAPFVKIGVDAYHQLKDAGLFADETPAQVAAGGPPGPGGGGPPGEPAAATSGPGPGA
ncbi:MAG TPA: AI-2E family transporter [Thermoleophilia bacterium]|nr:AI-2E family transporter [Thermoleophilia bacterium]